MKSFKLFLKYPGDHPDFVEDCRTNNPTQIITVSQQSAQQFVHDKFFCRVC